jgi:hypothetical protein
MDSNQSKSNLSNSSSNQSSSNLSGGSSNQSCGSLFASDDKENNSSPNNVDKDFTEWLKEMPVEEELTRDFKHSVEFKTNTCFIKIGDEENRLASKLDSFTGLNTGDYTKAYRRIQTLHGLGAITERYKSETKIEIKGKNLCFEVGRVFVALVSSFFPLVSIPYGLAIGKKLDSIRLNLFSSSKTVETYSFDEMALSINDEENLVYCRIRFYVKYKDSKVKFCDLVKGRSVTHDLSYGIISCIIHREYFQNKTIAEQIFKLLMIIERKILNNEDHEIGAFRLEMDEFVDKVRKEIKAKFDKDIKEQSSREIDVNKIIGDDYIIVKKNIKTPMRSGSVLYDYLVNTGYEVLVQLGILSKKVNE